MSAAIRPTPDSDDYRLPPGTPTRKVKIRCGCGVRARPIHAVESGIEYVLARVRLPPDLVLQSLWCRDCQETVKVTARDLHLSTTS